MVLKHKKIFILISIIFIISFFLYFKLAINDKNNFINKLNAIKPVSEYDNKAKIDDYDTIVFGHYEQDNILNNGKEPIEWICLYKKNNEALLLTKYVIDFLPYAENADSYYDSEIREWLNSEFYNNSFSDNEKDLILSSLVKNGINKFNINDGSDTYDKIFILSLDEYYNNLAYPKDSTSKPTNYTLNKHRIDYDSRFWEEDMFINDEEYWLRTSGTDIYCANFVWLGEVVSIDDGSDYLPTVGQSKNTLCGIRPAIRIKY